MTSTKLPLDGVRIVDQTLAWAGPFGTQLLADWGAEVIRVEPLQFMQRATRAPNIRPFKRPTSNWANDYPDGIPGERHWNRHLMFQVHGRNKLSITSDLPDPDCLEAYLKLVAISDVVMENNVPQTYAKIGASYEMLRQARPDIIMVRLPAYGLHGPYAKFRAAGRQMESMAGHNWIRGYRDESLSDSKDLISIRGTTYLADAVGGVSEAFATLAALCHRRETGEGQLVEVASTEAVVHHVPESVIDYELNGRIQGPLGNSNPSRVPQGCYRCQGDDNWLVISIGSDDEWSGLIRVMGDPPWARERRFATILGRYRCQEEIDEHISVWTRDKDHVELMNLLQAEGVPAAPVYDQRELFDDPHMKSREFFQDLHQFSTGNHQYPGMSWKMTQTPNAIRRPSPMLGEQNEMIYKDLLGLTEQEYKKLEDAGHIGMDYPPRLYD